MSGKGNRAQVVMCSDEAMRRQIFPGMKLSEAKAVCADLIWRDYDEHLYREAQKKLSRLLIACSPKITAQEPGTFLLDADGLGYLGGEAKLCREIHKIANRAGYIDVHIGIADSAFAATVASKFKRKQFYIVPALEDGNFLSPLSIKHLPISEDMHHSLHELGIRTMGQLAALGEEALRQRFGKEGIIARELCKGVDKRQPHLPPLEREFKCFIDIGSAIELLHEIQFVIKSMIDRLSRDLREQGWQAEELQIAFFNDNDKFDDRPIQLLRPSNNAKFLLEVIKLSLEARPISREVTAIELKVTRFCKESWFQTELERTAKPDAPSSLEADLWSASNDNNSILERTAPHTAFPTPLPLERKTTTAASSQAVGAETYQLKTSDVDSTTLSLTLMLQRFVSRLGEDAVVKSIPNDHYLPEQAGAWLPVAHKPTTLPVLPVNITYINARTGPTGLTAGLALRRCTPPHPVLVDLPPASAPDQLPRALTYQSRWYTIKELTTPERLSPTWWDQSPKRSYYIALLHPKSTPSELLLALLVQDHPTNSWSIHGFYD